MFYNLVIQLLCTVSLKDFLLVVVLSDSVITSILMLIRLDLDGTRCYVQFLG